MDTREKRLEEILEWLNLRGFEADEKDIEIFKSIVGFATNDGYNEAVQVYQQQRGAIDNGK